MGFGILLLPPSPFVVTRMLILLVADLIASPLLGLVSLLVLLLYLGLLASSLVSPSLPQRLSMLLWLAAVLSCFG